MTGMKHTSEAQLRTRSVGTAQRQHASENRVIEGPFLRVCFHLIRHRHLTHQHLYLYVTEDESATPRTACTCIPSVGTRAIRQQLHMETS